MDAKARRANRCPVFCFVLLACLGGCKEETRPSAGARRGASVPVIVISIDTLRADHLPVYGYAGVSTPAIDALAADAIVFENAYSPCPLTLPSHVSMLTGLIPPEHGVRNNLGFHFDANATPSIPKLLRKRGYRTGAAVSAYVLRGGTGLSDAFEFYDDGISFRPSTSLGELSRPGAAAAEKALEWLAAGDDRPPFLLLHLFEPHAPYEPAPEFVERYAARPYDGEIASVDRIVGRFLDELKKAGIYDRALVILTSDHGEGLGDHGEQEHGVFLYREAIRVPLVVKLPLSESRGERVGAPVQLIDILPTVFDVLGLDPPPEAKGTSLLRVKANPVERRVFSETMYPRIHLGMSDIRSLTDAHFQFIDAPRPELYDIGSDPAEQRDVSTEQRRVFASMKAELSSYERRLQAPSNIDAEQARKLAALGYIGSTSSSMALESRDPKDFIVEIEALRSAARLAAEGKLDAAVARFREIVVANPESTDAWTGLADALEKSGRYDEAAEAYGRALTLVPGLTEETALSLASIDLNRGRFESAAKHAELAMITNPGAAHLVLGRIALARRDYASAEREARAARRDAHRKLQSDVLLAQALTGQGRANDAIVLLDEAKQAISRDGLDSVLMLEFARGDALAHAGRIPEAEAAFRDEIRLFPHDRQAYARLAALEWLQGRARESRDLLESMVKVNPGRDSHALALQTATALGDDEGVRYWRRKLDGAK
jgi:arylsulfatase A-like enzyme/Flp pilus assembly protein TadD